MKNIKTRTKRTIPKEHKIEALGLTVALALTGVVVVLWRPVLSTAEGLNGSIPSTHAGSPHHVTPDCTGVPAPCHTTIQEAVDAAVSGDEIRVAAGTYTGVHARPAPAGYPDPPASGVITQVVYISKTVTIRGGYNITFSDPSDPEANLTMLNAQSHGRALFITGDISPTFEGLRITNGDATGLGGRSGGNDAGGGAYIFTATATIRDSQVLSNTADYGGGLYLRSSDATLSENTIADNTTNDRGGGLYLWESDATLSGNAILSNTSVSYGGGLLLQFSDSIVSGNTLSGNTTSNGGGLYLWGSNDILIGNTIVSNLASSGGGVYLRGSSDATLINNVVIDNQVSGSGSGIYVRDSSPRLLHTTIARNSGSSGVYVTDFLSDYSAVMMTNTILVSHTVGIAVAVGNTATLESTLWHDNHTADWLGPGAVITGTHNFWGDPLFDADGYHLLEGSAAIDRGVDAGVSTDIDGEARDTVPDVGADEWIKTTIYLPLILKN